MLPAVLDSGQTGSTGVSDITGKCALAALPKSASLLHSCKQLFCIQLCISHMHTLQFLVCCTELKAAPQNSPTKNLIFPCFHFTPCFLQGPHFLAKNITQSDTFPLFICKWPFSREGQLWSSPPPQESDKIIKMPPEEEKNLKLVKIFFSSLSTVPA